MPKQGFYLKNFFRIRKICLLQSFTKHGKSIYQRNWWWKVIFRINTFAKTLTLEVQQYCPATNTVAFVYPIHRFQFSLFLFLSLGIFYQALLPYSILLCMQTLPKGQSWAAAASATKGSAGTIIISLKNFSNFLWKNLLNSTPGRKGFFRCCTLGGTYLFSRRVYTKSVAFQVPTCQIYQKN